MIVRNAEEAGSQVPGFQSFQKVMEGCDEIKIDRSRFDG